MEDFGGDDPEQLKDMASEAPVIRLVNHLIGKGIEIGASDIHIEPRKHNVQVPVSIHVGCVHRPGTSSGGGADDVGGERPSPVRVPVPSDIVV